jgi:L-seryl-tRNA(Ser) seleniumtransferase
VLPEKLAERLRNGRPAVLGHVAHGRLLLDLIAVDPSYDVAIADAVRAAAKD